MLNISIVRHLAFFLIISPIIFTCSKSDDSSASIPSQFTISVSASSGGTVNTTGGQYEAYEYLSISATPGEGYIFSGWSGTTATGNPINIQATSNQNITANFVKVYSLTVDIIGSGDVNQTVVNSAKGTNDYEPGKTVKLTAQAKSNWLFYKWSDFIDNKSEEINALNPRNIVMDKSKTVTVTFEQIKPLVDPNNTDKNNTVGKWKIRKKGPGTKRSATSLVNNCLLNSITFRSDGSFTIISDSSIISGDYYVADSRTINLFSGQVNIGRLTNVFLTKSNIVIP